MTINSLSELLWVILSLWILAFLLSHPSRWRRLIGWGTLVAANVYLILNFFHAQGTLVATVFQNLQLLLATALVIYWLAIIYISIFKGKS